MDRKKIASVLTAWPSLAPTPQEEEEGVGGSRIAVVCRQPAGRQERRDSPPPPKTTDRLPSTVDKPTNLLTSEEHGICNIACCLQKCLHLCRRAFLFMVTMLVGLSLRNRPFCK